MNKATKLYGGIDPGTSNGATAFLDQDKKVVAWWKYEDPYHQARQMEEMLNNYGIGKLHVSLEIPGYNGKWAKVAFRELGKNEGHHQGILSALNVPYKLVSPRIWQQKVLGGLNKGDKDVSRLFINRLYPDIKAPKASGIWDAICIALAGY